MSKTNEIMQKINEYITKHTNYIPSIGDGFDEIGDMIYNLEKKSEWNNHWNLYNTDPIYKNACVSLQQLVDELINKLNIDSDIYGDLRLKNFVDLCQIRLKLLDDYIYRVKNDNYIQPTKLFTIAY